MPRLALAVAALLLAGQAALADAPPFLAGFAEGDITPPLGTPRQGWNSKLVGQSVLDPIFARAAAFRLGDGPPLIVVQLDVALISAEDTAAVRKRIEADHGVPGARVMVAATHNHSGPAMIDEALPRSEAWIAAMVAGSARAAGAALKACEPAEMAVGTAFELGVSANRRVRMRDGTTRTHGNFRDPNALAFEGPIDPEVGVLALRARGGAMLGVLVNFACHPTHHGGDPLFSAGYPGVLARELKAQGVPVALFLQGAAGNISYDDPRGGPGKTMDEIGRILAGDVMESLSEPEWTTPAKLSAASVAVSLRYREPTEADLKGTAPGTQRFGEAGYYERKIPEVLEKIRREGGVTSGEVQVFRIGDLALASQPSESFAELGLLLKEGAWPVRTFVVGYANGMLGYLPHEDAFRRGGYECTFGPPSLMAPDAGRKLAEAAIELIKRGP